MPLRPSLGEASPPLRFINLEKCSTLESEAALITCSGKNRIEQRWYSHITLVLPMATLPACILGIFGYISRAAITHAPIQSCSDWSKYVQDEKWLQLLENSLLGVPSAKPRHFPRCTKCNATLI
ncbi:uncharacterized protein CLUP02_15520 [Colletotrichum lupini]|uniref:Uncharacterized protein n=1 Tax=Colletotrichum lupini TaxID=145971 RepID=A0A9Q8T673_9PEZI|nr:uncharacterized protein CLUP02_15520 [Colletotrichum lupini]UQC89989.1 hypothetical protein CLUP02_15520 [Colletotrichum lupini]